jgi:SAM-dependent methyltransferase
MRLNVGCGRRTMEGWTNLDVVDIPGVDVVADLDACKTSPLPFPDDYFDEFLLSHVIEHIKEPLPLMQELWRIAKPGALMTILVPHGASDDAWEDPTHVRAYFPQSFGYFSQPFYWRADYGYRGDWQISNLAFRVTKSLAELMSPDEIKHVVHHSRNFVREMVAELTCIKPIRESKRELQCNLSITIVPID